MSRDKIHDFYNDEGFSGSESESDSTPQKPRRRTFRRKQDRHRKLNECKDRRLETIGRIGSRRHTRWVNSHFYFAGASVTQGGGAHVDSRDRVSFSSRMTNLENSMLAWYCDSLGNNTKKEFTDLYEHRNIRFWDPFRSVDVDVHEKMIDFLQGILDEKNTDTESDLDDSSDDELVDLDQQMQQDSISMVQDVTLDSDSDWTETETETETEAENETKNKDNTSSTTTTTTTSTKKRRVRRRRKMFVPNMDLKTLKIMKRVVNSQFFQDIDATMFDYVQNNRYDPSNRKRVNVNAEPLYFYDDDSFQRLVTHRVAQYYGLVHEGCLNVETDCKGVAVSFPAKYRRRRIPTSSVQQYVELQMDADDNMIRMQQSQQQFDDGFQDTSLDTSVASTSSTSSGESSSSSVRRTKISRKGKSGRTRRSKKKVRESRDMIDGIPVLE